LRKRLGDVCAGVALEGPSLLTSLAIDFILNQKREKITFM
jgi:hypothetical protein